MFTTNVLFCVEHTYESDYRVAEHTHPCYEIVYYLEGGGEVHFNRKRYRFEKDAFIATKPEVKHTECGVEGTKVLYIGFEIFGEANIVEGLFRERDYGIREYLEKIYYEIKHWTPKSRELVNLLASVVIIKLMPAQEKKDRSADHNFDNVVAYISAHYQEQIEVKKLAQMVGYSYDHFRKMFMKKFNITVNEFILQKRIEAANTLLNEKDLPIKVIAANCGFSSVSQFCTKYHEVMGISPKQMQKKSNEKVNTENCGQNDERND